MVVPRKEKPSYLAGNLKLLRNSAGNTMEEMAEFLALKGKSSYNAYEEGRALPDIHKLMKLASYFEVSLEDLVYRDLSAPKNSKNIETTPLYEVELVPVSARAGYSAGFGDSTYLKKLKRIQIPYKPYGIARVFEIKGDSMEPEIEDRSKVLAIKIGTGEIKNNHTYIIITENGLLCKDIRLSEDKTTAYLFSKNEKYPPKHIQSSDILELWEVWKKDI
jgi:phage repressor protein C with HTH and peptisase S24 domain